MPRKNYVPETPKGKALAYLRGGLPRGYHGAAERTIRAALETNGSVLKFNRRDRLIEVYETPETPDSAPDDVIDFETAEREVEEYFEKQRRDTLY